MSINFVGNLAQDLPAKIVQVVRAHTTSEYNANSTSYSNTLSCSITLKSSSSHCLVIFQPVRLLQGGSTNGLYRLMNTTQGNAGMNTYRIPYNGSGGKNPNMIFNYGTTLTAGNTYTFHLQGKTTTADTNIIGDNGSTSSTTIIEYIP